MMFADEEGTHRRLMHYFKSVVFPTVLKYKGKVLRNTGDGFLAEFPSASAAVSCASTIQRSIMVMEKTNPRPERFQLRIGLNFGEVVVENDMVYGDTINVAARVESLARPGTIWLTESVKNQLTEATYFDCLDRGQHYLKNIPVPLKLYELTPPEADARAKFDNINPVVSGVSELLLPSIAVLPLNSDGGDPIVNRLAQDLQQSLAARLGSWRWFRVVLPELLFAGSPKESDAIETARALDVRYVLRGTLRSAQARVRVGVELIDGASGYQIWATVLERSAHRRLSIEDEIVTRVGALIDSQLQRSERRRAMAKSPDQVDAYDLMQKGYWHYTRRTKSHNERAIRLFSEALEYDPTLAPAITGKAACLFWAGQSRWADDADASLRLGLKYAQDAILADEYYPAAHLMLGQSLLFLGQQDAAIAAARHAIDLNPSYAGAWAFLGHAQTAAGKSRGAIRSIKRAFQLTSHGSRRFMWLSNLAIAHFHANEFEHALHVAQEASHLRPDHWLGNQALIVAHAALGRADDARHLVDKVRTNEPALEPAQYANRLPYQRDVDRTRIMDALTRAGWT